MSGFLKTLRGWQEDFGTVQSVLKSLGLWQLISALVIAAAVSIWSHLKHLQGPEIFVLALGAFAFCLTIITLFPKVLRPQVKVMLNPIPGPSPVQLLTVENRGAPVTLRAQCRLLNRRNDPNLLHRSTFRLEWDAPKKRSVKLRHGGSCNLVVAKAGAIEAETQQHYARPPEPDQKWIKIWGLSSEGEGERGEVKESSMWYYGDKRPEYDLEITIVGENHKPYVQCFTVRAGQSSALEMFAVACPAKLNRIGVSGNELAAINQRKETPN